MPPGYDLQKNQQLQALLASHQQIAALWVAESKYAEGCILVHGDDQKLMKIFPHMHSLQWHWCFQWCKSIIQLLKLLSSFMSKGNWVLSSGFETMVKDGRNTKERWGKEQDLLMLWYQKQLMQLLLKRAFYGLKVNATCTNLSIIGVFITVIKNEMPKLKLEWPSRHFRVPPCYYEQL